MGRKPFHNPFADLKRKLAERSAGAEGPGRGRAEAQEPEPREPSPAPASPEAAPTEADLWARATAGVSPIEPGPGVADPRPPAPGPPRFWHPDLEAIDQLRALVNGDLPFDLADSDEFIEGWVAGLDGAVVRKLRRGEYAVQGHFDMHGMTRGEARSAVDRFFREARGAGKRCVLLIHGRGSHSKDQVPVLKEALRSWLATARFGRHVLAFATARPEDGGAGAVYVLLRRAGR